MKTLIIVIINNLIAYSIFLVLILVLPPVYIVNKSLNDLPLPYCISIHIGCMYGLFGTLIHTNKLIMHLCVSGIAFRGRKSLVVCITHIALIKVIT